MCTSVSADFRELLIASLAERVTVSGFQLDALLAHCELMLKWNRTINLTSITKLEEVVERHYAESVFAASFLPEGPIRVVDVGSGPGFPGIPMAIMRPSAHVTVVESHQRKAVFLREAARGMANVRVVAKRAEDMEDRFDWLVSRAVSAEDLRPVLGMARSMVLLTGSDGPPDVQGVEWDSVQLPWGRQRFVRIGRHGSFT